MPDADVRVAKKRTLLARAVRLALGFGLLDLGAVVVSGGFSLLGPVEGGGVILRLLLVSGILLFDHLLRKGSRSGYDTGYIALLIVLVALLHFRGYRLRGDGLWYYSFAHSLAFDGDIDLANQYRSLGIEREAGSRPVRETGRARFTYPVGAPVLWVPFVELGHLGVALRRAFGDDTAYDGFSDPYFHAVALGNLLVGWVGLVLLDRLLRRWFPPWISFVASSGIVLGSFLAWYLTYHAIYTHALTFLLVTLVVKLWMDDPATGSDYAALGLVLGLATAVRWQSAVFASLPAISLSGLLRRRKWRFVSTRALFFAGAFLLGVFPQLLSWKTIYDRFYVGVPLGADYVRWGDPFLSEILFSSRHGLFSWSPILIMAALGLIGFIRTEPRKGLPLAGVILIVWYVNSTVADWWGGGSFGARRFDAALPILALGLGTALAWLTELVRRRPRAVVGALVGAVVMANALLMEQYRKGRIPVDDTMSWEVAIAAGVEDWFDAFGYPFSFPMNWLFALRYDRPKTQYDILVGQYLFHRMHDLGGVIDLGPRDPPFIGNGWSGLRDWKGRKREVRLAEGRPAGVFIPVDQPEPLHIHIACAAAEGNEPVAVEVRLNGVRLAAFVPTREMMEHSMSAEAALWKRINLLELAPVDADPVGAFLAVDRLRFERLQP